jgi:6-phosphofructokinase 1
VGHTALSIGVDTAVNTIVEACDRISDTARAHRRAFIVEVMGRQCGYLAMRAGIAAEADAILFAERRRSEDDIVQQIGDLLRQSFAPGRDKRRVLIVKAEGVEVPTHRLMARLQEQLDAEIPGVTLRETILGHVVRGGRPSATDRVLAQRLALGAVLAAEEGAHDVMMAWEPPGAPGAKTVDPSVRRVPLGDVLAETERLVDGSSVVVRRRVELLEQVEGLLAL